MGILRLLGENSVDLDLRNWLPGAIRNVNVPHCCTKEAASIVCETFVAQGSGESWPTCLDLLPRIDCLVYSFGIDRSWGYDDSMAARGCEVHSFDPTKESREAHESHNVPGVHFH